MRDMQVQLLWLGNLGYSAMNHCLRAKFRLQYIAKLASLANNLRYSQRCQDPGSSLDSHLLSYIYNSPLSGKYGCQLAPCYSNNITTYHHLLELAASKLATFFRAYYYL